MSGFGTEFFPVFYQTGGGGGPTIPTITADTTLNVPAAYPTINDALDYVRSAVVLNGAQVTIAVNGGAYVCNEQITIVGENLDYVSIVATAPVTVNTAGFLPHPVFGAPVFFDIENASLGAISGTFAPAAPDPVIGWLLNKGASVDFGQFGVTFTTSNFLYAIAAFSSSFNCVDVNASASDITINLEFSTVNGDFAGTTTITSGGASAIIAENSTVRFGTLDITANNGQCISVQSTTFTMEAGNLTTVNGARVLNAFRSLVDLAGTTITQSAQTDVVNAFHSNVNVYFVNLVNGGANNPAMLAAYASVVNIEIQAVAGVISIGMFVTATVGSTVFANLALLPNFTGGYNQPVNVPTINGLIYG